MENMKKALREATTWEDLLTIEDKKLQISYYELRELIVERIMEKYHIFKEKNTN